MEKNKTTAAAQKGYNVWVFVVKTIWQSPSITHAWSPDGRLTDMSRLSGCFLLVTRLSGFGFHIHQPLSLAHRMQSISILKVIQIDQSNVAFTCHI